MNRFEIWVTDLPAKASSSLHQPVLIVSFPEEETASPLVTVIPLTTEQAPQHIPSHVPLLNSPYCALCEQPATIDKKQLIRRIGSVEDAFDRFALNRALANHLGLTPMHAIYIQEGNIYEHSGLF